MKARKFSIDYETFFKVREAGHNFTVFQDTPARFLPIVVDGHAVSLPACGSLSEAVSACMAYCGE